MLSGFRVAFGTVRDKAASVPPGSGDSGSPPQSTIISVMRIYVSTFSLGVWPFCPSQAILMAHEGLLLLTNQASPPEVLPCS